MTLSPLVINDLHPRSRPVSVSQRDREYHSSPSPARARARARVCACVCVSVDKKSVLPDYIIGGEGRADERKGRARDTFDCDGCADGLEEGYRPEATESLYREVLGEKRQGISREARVSRISGS